MIIKRLGKIFDPTHHTLPLGCEAFAQSPQALVFDDYVRIYFSTRAKDSSGKFLSHIAYVDMDYGLQRLLNISSGEVIPLGALGCFDEHGIFPFSVTRHGDSIFAYTTGWSRRVAVSVETGVGLAVSHDLGETFTRVGDGPILTASLDEPFLVGDAFVREFGDQFHMWYIYGTEWKQFAADAPPERVYKIGYASSEDGADWQKQRGPQLIPDLLGPNESQALPSVAKYKDCYHMVFCYRESYDFRTTQGRGYRLGYARSNDLHQWERLDDQIDFDLPAEAWDSDMQAYPHLFVLDGRLLLLYNGNEFGRYGFGLAELTF